MAAVFQTIGRHATMAKTFPDGLRIASMHNSGGGARKEACGARIGRVSEGQCSYAGRRYSLVGTVWQWRLLQLSTRELLPGSSWGVSSRIPRQCEGRCFFGARAVNLSARRGQIRHTLPKFETVTFGEIQIAQPVWNSWQAFFVRHPCKICLNHDLPCLGIRHDAFAK